MSGDWMLWTGDVGEIGKWEREGVGVLYGVVSSDSVCVSKEPGSVLCGCKGVVGGVNIGVPGGDTKALTEGGK